MGCSRLPRSEFPLSPGLGQFRLITHTATFLSKQASDYRIDMATSAISRSPARRTDTPGPRTTGKGHPHLTDPVNLVWKRDPFSEGGLDETSVLILVRHK